MLLWCPCLTKTDGHRLEEGISLHYSALRRQLEAAQKQIIDLKLAVSTARLRPSDADSTQVAALKAANQKIAALTADVRQADVDAQEADAELAQARDEIAELRKQLRAEQMVLSLTQPSRQPTQASPAPGNQPTQALSKPVAVPRIVSPAPTSTTAPQPFPGSTHQGTPRNQLAKQHGPATLPEPLPWERPANRPGRPPIPRWMGMPEENFDEIYEFSQRVLEALPEFIHNLGDDKTAPIMQSWLSAPENVEPLGALSRRIVLHIVSIERPQRRTRAQREALGPLVLHHALNTMEIDQPALAQELKKVLAIVTQHVLFERLTFELLEACRGKELRHNEQRGTWQFFVRNKPRLADKPHIDSRIVLRRTEHLHASQSRRLYPRALTAPPFTQSDRRCTESTPNQPDRRSNTAPLHAQRRFVFST